MLNHLPDPVRERLWQAKHSAARWFDRRGFAHSLHAQIERHLTHFGITVAIDVGANTGQYAHTLRRLGFRGRIISFEPNPDAAADLTQRAASDPLWDVVPIAAGDEEGTAHLHMAADSVFSSILETDRSVPDHFRAPMQTTRIAEVPVRRLDDVLPAILDVSRERIHLKTDTQGFDIHAIRGASGILPSVHSLLMELSFVPLYEGQRPYAEDVAEVGGYGFSLSCLSAVARDDRLRIVEADGLFCR